MENKQQGKPLLLKRGLWKPEEDLILKNYVETHGEGNWANVSQNSGLMRGGKSCRLRWKNYLRPNLKRGGMSEEEEDLIIRMHKLLGNRWSLIAGRLPGRTDNEVKNYWNTHLNKKCHTGKRKPTDTDDNSKKKKQSQSLNSQPICSTSMEETTTQGLELELELKGKNEANEANEEKSIVTSSWMEDIRSLNYDIETPLVVPNSAAFVFDDDLSFVLDDYLSFAYFDSFFLF